MKLGEYHEVGKDVLLVRNELVGCVNHVYGMWSQKGCGTDTTIDLSGRWNDADSRQVSEAMVMDCLSHPWVTAHSTGFRGKKPVVITGEIRNRSMEHVAIGTFINDIERAFINWGQVAVVASAVERDEIRTDKEDQRAFSSLETIKK